MEHSAAVAAALDEARSLSETAEELARRTDDLVATLAHTREMLRLTRRQAKEAKYHARAVSIREMRAAGKTWSDVARIHHISGPRARQIAENTK